MSRSGPFSNARGSSWVRRIGKGRSLWGPSDPSEGLAVGGGSESSDADNLLYDSVGNRTAAKLFFDPSNGSFRVGTIRRLTTSATAHLSWDRQNRGYGSIVLGHDGATASGYQSFLVGAGGTASNVRSIAIGLATNSSGQDSICLGNSTIASATNALAMGSTSTASGGSAVSVAGTASNTNATALRGTASGVQSTSVGIGAAASRFSQVSIAGGIGFAAVGDAQCSIFQSNVTTSDATATELLLGSNAATYITIGATRTMSFEIKIAAHRTDVSGTAAAWPSIRGAITRDSSGNCRLLGAVTGAGTTTLADAGGVTWSVAITADSTNNRLAITVTGEAAKTIRWTATTTMAEVG